MRDQESLSNRRLDGFPGPRPWIRGRNGPVVDLLLACRSRPAGIAGASSSRRRSPRPRRRRPLGFIWPICNTGIGTPAPVFPTRHLDVTGLYRYVRNPMYVAVVEGHQTETG